MGSSGKLGRHIALHFLRRDYEVIAQCRTRCNELEKILKDQGTYHLIEHDFLSGDLKELIEKIGHAPHTLDASILIEPIFHQMAGGREWVEYWKVIKVNLAVPLMLLHQLHSLMKPGGAVVFLSDLLPERGLQVYQSLTPSLAQLASSAGIHAVVREAPKVFKDRLRVFGVALGWMNIGDFGEALERVPMQRAGRLEELTKILTYLVEEAPSYMSGSLILLSGGL
jgi:NAD(P)-dependent dehydrogenase (short-subunit alcohol dehydrogenase family)